MIIGIGTDIIHISRFREMDNIKLNNLAERICTDNELIEYQNILDKPLYISKKWASKEAISKALGTGIGNGTKWKDFEISHDILGKPIIIFINESFNNYYGHISISDERDIIIVYTLIETK
jgi:holo-[acyl-carrier protein] synthase